MTALTFFSRTGGLTAVARTSPCSCPDSRTSSTALGCPLRAKLTASRLVSTSSPCSRRRPASASPLAEATPDLRKHGKTPMDGFSHLFELVLLHGRCRAICRPQIPSVAVESPAPAGDSTCCIGINFSVRDVLSSCHKFEGYPVLVGEGPEDKLRRWNPR
jgi:hypothetical protein